jgi:hypothetical protein
MLRFNKLKQKGENMTKQRQLKQKEIAEFLSVTPGAIKTLTNAGLPHRMVGKTPRYDRDEVLAWLKENTPINRKDILLRATYDLLKICHDSTSVLNVIEEDIFYDDNNCDGFCLMEDIANVLKIDS